MTRGHRQAGQAALETMIVMGFLFTLIFGFVHICMFVATKSLTNYAAFTAARADVGRWQPRPGGPAGAVGDSSGGTAAGSPTRPGSWSSRTSGAREYKGGLRRRGHPRVLLACPSGTRSSGGAGVRPGDRLRPGETPPTSVARRGGQQVTSGAGSGARPRARVGPDHGAGRLDAVHADDLRGARRQRGPAGEPARRAATGRGRGRLVRRHGAGRPDEPLRVLEPDGPEQLTPSRRASASASTSASAGPASPPSASSSTPTAACSAPRATS